MLQFKDNVIMEISKKHLQKILPEFIHSLWSGWMKYLFDHGINNPDGSWTIFKDKVYRWKRQMETSYEDLPELEKKSDIEIANVLIGILEDKSK